MKILSPKVHTIIGLLVGVALLFAADLFGFRDSQTATSVARIIGAVIILNELISKSPFGVVKLVSMRAHVIIDCLTGAVLALSPWLFGFANTSANHWLPHLIVGVVIIGYALATRLRVGEEKPATL